jgi:putative endonuclease
MNLNTRQKGNRGEDVACVYLKKHGFLIQERNYLRKWGEIDIVGVKKGILHFFEVKSITSIKGMEYRPEENVHGLKVRKLRRVIQTYLNERKYGNEIIFQFHVISVVFDRETGKAKVKMLNNIIL